MKFNNFKSIFCLIMLASFTAQPAQGMSYVRAAYNKGVSLYRQVKHFFYPDTAISDIVKDTTAATKQIIDKMPASIKKIDEQKAPAQALTTQPVHAVDTNIDYEKAARRLGIIAGHLTGERDQKDIFLQPVAAHEQGVSQDVFLKHVKVMQELKQRMSGVAKKKDMYAIDNAKLTPTKAYFNAMNVSKSKEELRYKKSMVENIEKYPEIFVKVLSREEEFCESHEVFYHAQLNNFNIVRDLLKEIYAKCELMHIGKDFQFLRNWIHAPEFTVSDLFTNYRNIDDHEPEISRILLSVNLSLFGNAGSCGEETFGYFKDNHSFRRPSIAGLLEEIFNYFGFNCTYLERLLELNAKLKTNEGVLLQIFIPKEKVNDYAYLSSAGGMHHELRPTLSAVIEQYKKDPKVLGNFDSLQARILLSKDCMLNPKSGVKIFRYTMASKENKREYKKQLKAIVDSMFAELINNGNKNRFINTKLGKLLALSSSPIKNKDESNPALTPQPTHGVDTSIDYEKAAHRLQIIAHHLQV
jgi:hypothetical protein